MMIRTIPRADMPQVPLDEYGILYHWLHRAGIGWHHDFLDPVAMQVKQKPDRLKHLDLPLILSYPIIVSREPIVLDGHHRRENALRLHMNGIPTLRIVQSFEDARRTLFRFLEGEDP